MKNTLLQLIEIEQQKRMQNIFCRNTVTALMSKMFINPNDFNLVFIIGTGMEKKQPRCINALGNPTT